MRQRSGIAAGHPATVEAVAEVLADGGNAFDSCVAGLLAACVVEPVLASLGGGGFLIAAPDGGRARVYDFFSQTPLVKRPEADLDFQAVLADFGTATQEFHVGAGAIAVPGMLKGLERVAADLGRLPFRRLTEPAQRLARQGPPLAAMQAFILSVVTPIYSGSEACRQIYCGGSGPSGLKAEGEPLAMPAFADALEALAIEGSDLFYKGEMGARLAETCFAGGHLTREDLERYSVEIREPLVSAFAGNRLLINPPPCSGGLLIALALRLLEGHDLSRDGWGGAAHGQTLCRVMEATNRARIEQALDERAAEGLGDLDPGMLEYYRAQVWGRTAANRGTTHISVIDKWGQAAGATVSNGEGSGIILDGTGIMLNNMLGEEDINPVGFHRWQPNTRLASMMAPALLQQVDGRITVLGSGGSNRIRTAILQVLVNLMAFEMDLEEAISAPRLHGEGDLLSLEAGYAFEDHCFARTQIWPEPSFFFGGVHAVSRLANGSLQAAGDPRRGGVARIL